MKNKYLLILLIPFFVSVLNAQTISTETFETEAQNSTSFTDNGQVFNITSQSGGTFDVYSSGVDYGWSGTVNDFRFIDNSGSATSNQNCGFTIASAGATPFRIVSFWIYLSRSNLASLGTGGSLTVVGKLGGVTQFTATSSSGFNSAASTNNGYTLINFATFGGSNNTTFNIDQLVISTGGLFEYAGLDAFVWSTVAATTSAITASGTLSTFTACAGAASAQQSFNVSGSSLSSNIVVTPPTGFEVSTTSGSGFASSVTLTQSGGTVSSTTVYVRLTNAASGTPSGNITCASTGATTKNVSASGTVNTLPTITLGSVTSINTTATSFSLPYSATTGSPNQYSIVTGSPTALPSFTALSNATLPASPISVTIPASAANTYNFVATVRNSTTGCVSNNTPFTVQVTALSAGSSNFTFTGTQQTYTVPSCVNSINVKIYGAAGTNGQALAGFPMSYGTIMPGGTGGKGAYVQATLAVTPGSTIYLNVGGNNGYNGGGAGGGAGGGNNGSFTPPANSQAGNGGGASDIRIGGSALSNRVLVAGGGGGGGNGGGISVGGSASGNPTGGNGGNSSSIGINGGSWTIAGTGIGTGTFIGGRGGTASAGGAVGDGCSFATGVVGLATGAGGCGNILSYSSGGGGGGGYVNGGGGGGGTAGTTACTLNYSNGGGGGAGGSNYTIGATNVTVTDGFQSGNGSIEITPIFLTGISVTGTLNPFSTCAGSASSQQSFSVSGCSLTDDITIVPPTGYEISTTSGSNFTNSITLTQTSGSIANTTIYVRLTNAASGTPSGNITCTSTGSTTQNVSASGTVNALPTITLGSVIGINTSATSFSLPYSATTGSPNQYSITTGSPTALPSFIALSNVTLPISPISVTIPASAVNTYNFVATVRNSTTTCVSANNNFTVVVSPVGTTINSITRGTPSGSATNASSVTYVVTFGASVTGLTTSNFSLTTSGVSGASITSLSGSGSSYSVVVNTGTGSGSIVLNLANATGLTPGITTTLPFAGETYTIDKTNPTVVTKNRTVYLNAVGTGTVSALQVNNGSSDASGIASLSLSQTSFTCANSGTPVTVILTATDINGNSGTETATITVLDTVKPVVNTQNRTVYLNSSGTASIRPSEVDNGSSDACGIDSLALSKVEFSCSDTGAHIVKLWVMDIHGNANTGTATVTVIDTIKPQVITQDRTIYLNSLGIASIMPSEIDNGSSDACGIDSLALSKTEFNCSDIGQNTITLTVTDANGNVNSGTATLIVLDTITTPPSGSSIQSFIKAGTISDLKVIGSNIKWYSNATGGNSLDPSTALVNNKAYYASQTITVCESRNRLKVNVIIINNISKVLDIVSCGDFTFNAKTYNKSGIIKDTIQGVVDTFFTINLTNTLPTAVSLSDNFLTSRCIGCTYQWYLCDNNGLKPIFGATNQSLEIVSNKNYAVEISNGQCKDTTKCYNVAGLLSSISNTQFDDVTIYPNPTSGKLKINLTQFTKNVDLVLVDNYGKVIRTIQEKNITELEMNIESLANGLYYLRISNEAGDQIYKIIKQ
jgi:hypothetical protein